ADEHRLREAQPLIAIGEGEGINFPRRQADADGEGHRAMRDPLAERARPHRLRIHVVREEVPGMAGMDDEVGFRDGAPIGLARLADRIVLEMPRSFHQRLASNSRLRSAMMLAALARALRHSPNRSAAACWNAM